MKQRLTNKQLEVYCFMKEFFKENDQLPPNSALANKFGWETPGTAAYHMAQLREAGYLERNAVGKHRFSREKME